MWGAEETPLGPQDFALGSCHGLGFRVRDFDFMVSISLPFLHVPLRFYGLIWRKLFSRAPMIVV